MSRGHAPAGVAPRRPPADRAVGLRDHRPRGPAPAQDKLLRWIKKDPRFHKRLLRLSNSRDDNDYNAEQIRLMVQKWGEPGEYDDY